MRQWFGKILLSIVVCTLVFGLATGGCGKKDDTPDVPDPNTDVAVSDISDIPAEGLTAGTHDWGKSILAKTLGLWEQGKADEALAEFVTVDFSKSPLFDETCALSLSNRDIELMDADGRQAAMDEVMSRIGTLQGICNAAMAKGRERGEAAYLVAVQKYADAVLGQEEVLAFLEMVTTGLKEAASRTNE